MDGDFSGFEFNIDWPPKRFSVGDGLVQNIGFVVFAEGVREMPKKVRTGDVPHAGILHCGVIDGEPCGDGHRGRQRPVTRILVPRDALAVAGHFAKEVRTPCNHVLADQVLHTGENAGVGKKVVNAPIAQVCRADRVAVLARGESRGQQFIEVATDGGNLVLAENSNTGEVAVAIESGDLLRREGGGVLGGGGMKPQIAV